MEHVTYIYYLIQFKKDKTQIQTLIAWWSKVNAIYLTFVKKLGFLIRPTDVGVQKIDGTTLDTHEMVVATFLMTNKANQVRFFKKIFLVANIGLEAVFRMFFLTLSDADIDFLDQKFWWRTYTTKEAFPTIRRVKLVGKKKFAAAALDPEYKTFKVHVTSFSSIPLNFHHSRRPQISGLITKKASTKIPDKYFNFVDMFSLDLASKFFKHTEIYNHAIKLIDGQQPHYEPIYSLKPVKLETLNAYIETNLANGFIKPSKFPAGAPILFNRKSDDFFQLCVDY